MIKMLSADEFHGIILIIFGILIVITGLLFLTTILPITPLEIELIKNGNTYILSYNELLALNMTGYAALALFISNLINGFTIFVIVFGCLRLTWSGLHLYSFWDHIRPYLRSGHVRIWE